MSTIQDSDQFLVQRDSDSFKQSAVNLMSTILDTDYMLVQRGEDSFKVSCLDVKDQLGGGGSTPPVLQSVTLVQDAPIDANRFTGKSFTSTVSNAGQAATALDMTATVTGVLGIKAGSAPIETNNYLGGSAVVLNLESDVNLGTVVEVGDTVTASASYTPQTSEITAVNVTTGTFAGANSDWTHYLSVAPSGGPAFAPEGSGSYIYGNFSDENNSYYEIAIPPIYIGSAIKIAWRGSGTGNYNSNVLELRDDANNIILSTPFDNPSNNQSVSNIVSVGSVTGTVTKLRLRIDAGWPGPIDNELLGGFAGIYVDDVKIVDGDTYSSTQLTFADNTDLKYFQAGDVVQEAVNQRVYSDGFISGQPSAGNKADVFDGNYGIGKTYPGYGCVTTNLKACVFNPPIAFEGGTIEVAAYRTEGGGAFTVYIDGTRYDINIANTNNLQWNSRDDLPAGNIESFGMNTNANAWGQVRLNGVDLIDGNGTVTPEVKVISADPANSQMVVDGGKWAVVNDSRVWSDSATVSGTEVAGKDKTKAFDGTDTVAAISASGQYFNFVFDPPIPVNTSLRLKSAVSSTSVNAGNFQINDLDRSTIAIGFPAAGGIASDVAVWTTIPSEFITDNELSQLRIGWSGAWQNIAGIEVDGRLLLDKGIHDLGETSVSTPSPKEGSGTLSAINGTQVTIEPFTDNCFVEGQFLTVDKTIDVSPVTDPIASYDDATKTLTFTDSKDLIQFANGDEVYMADADGSAVSPTFTTSAITVVAPANYAAGGTITGAIHPSSGKTLDTIFNGIVSKTYGINNGVCTGNGSNNVLTFGSPIVLTEDDELKAAMFKNGNGGQIVDMRFDDGSTLRFQATDLPLTTVSGTVEENLTTIDHQGRNLVGMNYFGSGSNVTTVNGFYLNGSLLIDGETTVLTFADSTNFNRFQIGDEVGAKGVAGIQTYTGGAAQSITGYGFSPDIVWIKDRQTAYNHQLYDTFRGTEVALLPNTNAGSAAYNSFTSFDSDGFTVPATAGTNTSGKAMVAWCWDAGDGEYVTNNDGAVASSVKASDVTGLSISNFSFTTAGSITTWGHGLSTAPQFVLFKVTNQSNNWIVWHKDLGNRDRLLLTSAAQTSYGFDVWSSDNSTLGIYGNIVAGGGTALECMAYAWAPVAGKSKFDFYTGTGTANLKVTTGFKPDYLLIRIVGTGNGGDWFIFDSARGGISDPIYNSLYANLGGVEEAGTSNGIRFVDDGFEIATTNDGLNEASQKYLYAAFAAGSSASIVDIDSAVSQMTIDADVKSVGDTLSVTKSGTGTVDSVNVATKSMTLSASNDQWVDGYRTATPTKPAIATTAYLQFDETGAVSGYSPVPVPVRAMNNLITPQLTFPAEFSDTGTAPDAEFADANAYLEVSVTLKNQNGESGPKSSNAVVPSTNTRSISAGEVTNNAESVGRMIEQVVTHEQRVADNYADEMKKRKERLQAAMDLQKKGMARDGKA